MYKNIQDHIFAEVLQSAQPFCKYKKYGLGKFSSMGNLKSEGKEMSILQNRHEKAVILKYQPSKNIEYQNIFYKSGPT